MAHTSEFTHGFGPVALLRSLFDGVQMNFARQRAFTQTYNQLGALSDRELADIGLGRSEILDIARETAARL